MSRYCQDKTKQAKQQKTTTTANDPMTMILKRTTASIEPLSPKSLYNLFFFFQVNYCTIIFGTFTLEGNPDLEDER